MPGTEQDQSVAPARKTVRVSDLASAVDVFADADVYVVDEDGDEVPASGWHVTYDHDGRVRLVIW